MLSTVAGGGDGRSGRCEDSHVEALVPVRVECLLHDTCGVRLFGIDGDDRKGIGEAEDFALGEAIGGNDCAKVRRRLR